MIYKYPVIWYEPSPFAQNIIWDTTTVAPTIPISSYPSPIYYLLIALKEDLRIAKAKPILPPHDA